MDNFLIEPPSGLLQKVMDRLHKEERLYALRRVVLFSVVAVGSLVGLLPAFNNLAADFNQSGFWQFFSLAFSDFSIITEYWKSFLMMLLETLPVMSLALFLAVIATFLQSVRSLNKNVKLIKRANA